MDVEYSADPFSSLRSTGSSNVSLPDNLFMAILLAPLMHKCCGNGLVGVALVEFQI